MFYFDYLPEKLFHGVLGIKFHYVNDCCKGTKNTDTHLFLLSASSSELVFLRRDDERFLLLSKGLYDSSSLSFGGGGGSKNSWFLYRIYIPMYFSNELEDRWMCPPCSVFFVMASVKVSLKLASICLNNLLLKVFTACSLHSCQIINNEYLAKIVQCQIYLSFFCPLYYPLLLLPNKHTDVHLQCSSILC